MQLQQTYSAQKLTRKQVILSSFKLLFDFKGRTSKRDFGIWSLFCITLFVLFSILTIGIMIYGVILEEESYDSEMGQTYYIQKEGIIYNGMMACYLINVLIMNLLMPAILVRRLRDASKSVSIALLAIIPNILFSLVPLMLLYDVSFNLAVFSTFIILIEIIPLIATCK